MGVLCHAKRFWFNSVNDRKPAKVFKLDSDTVLLLFFFQQVISEPVMCTFLFAAGILISLAHCCVPSTVQAVIHLCCINNWMLAISHQGRDSEPRWGVATSDLSHSRAAGQPRTHELGLKGLDKIERLLHSLLFLVGLFIFPLRYTWHITL